MEGKGEVLPVATLGRMPKYLRYLKLVRNSGVENISSVALAKALDLNSVQVRKDLAFATKSHGKPKVGFSVVNLIADIEDLLGCYLIKNAVLVGVGKLGKTLLSYNGFNNYGLNIVAGFDVAGDGAVINGKPVYPIKMLPEVIAESGAKMGIITVPKTSAQEVCDMLIASGIKGIWNFAAAHLNVPDGVAVKNEDLAASLAILSLSMSGSLSKDVNKE